MNIFGDWMKKKRLKAGLTLREVGLVLGYTSHQFPWNWENGKSLPPLKKMHELAELLKSNDEEILKYHRLQKLSDLKETYEDIL